MSLFSWRSIINKSDSKDKSTENPNLTISEPKIVSSVRSKISKTVRSLISSFGLKSEDTRNHNSNANDPSFEPNLDPLPEISINKQDDPELIEDPKLIEEENPVSSKLENFSSDAKPINVTKTSKRESIYPDIRTPISQDLLDEYYSDPELDIDLQDDQFDSELNNQNTVSFEVDNLEQGSFSHNPFATFLKQMIFFNLMNLKFLNSTNYY